MESPTVTSEEDLPVCSLWSVCNKLDTYSTPWIERQCRCSGTKSCSTSLDANDGHTLGDKSRQLKLCEPINKLPVCRYFRDITWTLTTNADNTTTQTVNCVCPKNSVAYIFKHQIFKSSKMGIGYKYLFACSPETRLRCERKEPCRLFTVRKRPDVEEVNTNTLCQCAEGYVCPTHHKQANVITAGTVYGVTDHIRTYSGYCSKPVK
ncbi:unnamed protein product [Oppiella nova]|uniref:Protein giant-lens n=1 Tax=Oppiella nova TaxID=334625 RepID=A0A7R9LTV4_9ACAR|nr:unnamed protein product [Oppiella nova]CAG2166901.1 unnamed protein product [Oppiella nova]